VEEQVGRLVVVEADPAEAWNGDEMLVVHQGFLLVPSPRSVRPLAGALT
jgi:hypothetical protein